MSKPETQIMNSGWTVFATAGDGAALPCLYVENGHKDQKG